MLSRQQALKNTNMAFRTPFFVEGKTVTQDENGIQREIWKTKGKFYGDIKNLYGQEYEIARQRTDKRVIKILTRYTKHICEDDRILLRLENDVPCYFRIELIDNINFRGDLIEIRATEAAFDD